MFVRQRTSRFGYLYSESGRRHLVHDLLGRVESSTDGGDTMTEKLVHVHLALSNVCAEEQDSLGSEDMAGLGKYRKDLCQPPEEGRGTNGESIMGQRRTERQGASWRGACVVDGEMETVGWRECQVTDISMFGMGLTLRHRHPWDLVGRVLSVQILAGAGCLSAHLEGTVKHARTMQTGLARVGIDFRELSRVEQVLATGLDAATQTREPDGQEFPRSSFARSISMPRWSTERTSPSFDLFPGRNCAAACPGLPPFG